MAIQDFAGQVKTANFLMPSEVRQNVAQAGMMEGKNAMIQSELQDQQAARASKQKLNALFQQSGGDLTKMRQGVKDYGTAVQLDKTIGEQGKLQAQTDKERMSAGIEKLNYGSQLLSGATPDNWQQIRQEFGQMTGQDLGEQFDPNKVSALMQQGLAMKDKLANEWKAKGYELDVAKFGEMQRHNVTTEGISQQNANKYSGSGGGEDSAKNWDVDLKQGVRVNRATGEVQPLKQNGAEYKPTSTASTKPLPPQALKMQQESLDAIGTAGSINADLGAVNKMIEDGKLDFGPVSNILNNAKNAAGISDENSRNFATFKSTLEKLRNDSLRLNKGVQTDGDAQRAWNELFQNINDKDVVKQRLGEIQKINERGAALQQMNVDTIRANYGADPLDASGRLQQAPALGNQQDTTDHSSLWN